MHTNCAIIKMLLEHHYSNGVVTQLPLATLLTSSLAVCVSIPVALLVI